MESLRTVERAICLRRMLLCVRMTFLAQLIPQSSLHFSSKPRVTGSVLWLVPHVLLTRVMGASKGPRDKSPNGGQVSLR